MNKRQTSRFMKHWWNHRLIVIDLETTGTVVGYHEVVQIAMVQLDRTFKPIGAPWEILIKPDYVERIDAEAARKCPVIKRSVREGLDREYGLEATINWLESGLDVGKRILPLGHGYMFDRLFLERYMGTTTYNEYFDNRIRDTQGLANYTNDYEAAHGREPPFPRTTLGTVASVLDIDYNPKQLHDALYDCYITAKVYAAFCYKGI